MTESDRVLPRRAVLKTAGLGVGAGLFSGVSAPAQGRGHERNLERRILGQKGRRPSLYIP
jgi:hypothetical protein